MIALIKTLLVVHIAAGAIAFISAPVAMLVKKGGNLHRLSGKVFFWCMTVVTATAIAISIFKSIPFLLMIACLSYYSVVSGYRSLYHKNLGRKGVIKPVDWIALSINAIANAVFLIWGLLLTTNNVSLAILAMTFGLFGLLLSVSNLRAFLKQPTDRMYWLYSHIGGFIGGYIATVTAFSVTTLTFIPGIWAWIWPSIIGIPIISIFTAQYKRKFRGGAKPSEILVLKSK